MVKQGDLELDANGDVVATRMRWDDPQPPFDAAAFREAVKAQLQRRPRPSVALVPPSLGYAWCRRWAAHRLSRALGYPSKEPPIR